MDINVAAQNALGREPTFTFEQLKDQLVCPVCLGETDTDPTMDYTNRDGRLVQQHECLNPECGLKFNIEFLPDAKRWDMGWNDADLRIRRGEGVVYLDAAGDYPAGWNARLDIHNNQLDKLENNGEGF